MYAWRSSASSSDSSASSSLEVPVGVICSWNYKKKAETYKRADQGHACSVTVPTSYAGRAGPANIVQVAAPRQLFQHKVSI